MMSLVFIGGLLVLGIGLIAKFVLDRKESDLRITWMEYAIASAAMLLIVIPLTSWIGTSLAFQNTVSYNQFLNGFEKNAVREEIKCARDGSCTHVYDCDPYTVQEPYDCSYYEGEGEDRRLVQKTCYRSVTKYHSCPYTDYEYTYTIRTTLGDYTIAEHWLPDDPESHRWRSYKAVPTSLPSGVPQFWRNCKERLDRNQPGPVTSRSAYDNYILASQNTILRNFSQDIANYKQAGLLPKINPTVRNTYYADRVYLVGVNVPGNWQDAQSYFNGAFGLELEGDLHLVIVDANQIQNPDNYIGALTAYWQSAEFGRNALAQNGLVVVIGTTDGKTIAWSRAQTGMPQGNEELLIDIRDKLKGTDLTPEALLGPPGGQVKDNTVQVVHGSGSLEKLVWGTHKFQRLQMRDYEYLKHEIEPTGWQKFWIYFVIVVFGCIAWAICIQYGTPAIRRIRRD